jgi:hypothetical protein
MSRFRVFLLVGVSIALRANGGESQPPIDYTVGSDAVRILVESDGPVPVDCVLIGPIEVQDGFVGSARWRYQGTEERALQRLRNLAVSYHANTVSIERTVESLQRGSETGREIGYTGKAYRCD